MTAEIKDKPKGKSRADDTRIDVRFPLSILQAIEQIAEQDGAKIHHISGKRILTPTVIELVRLGLCQVSDKYQLEISDTRLDHLAGKVSDTLTPRVELIEGELADLKKLVTDLSDKLSDGLSVTSAVKLSDNNSDKLSDKLPELVSDTICDTLSDINIQLSDTLPDKLPKRLEGLTRSQLDRAIELFGEGVSIDDRNIELAELFGWKPDKTPKSKNEDASRIKKALREAGLIE